MNHPNPFEAVDLQAILNQSSDTGPNWGTETEDLDCTFLVWREGDEVKAHSSSEVDVVMVVVEGEGEVTVSGDVHAVKRGTVVVIPKSTTRIIRATSTPFAYLNVHKRRKRLMPTSLKPGVDKPWKG